MIETRTGTQRWKVGSATITSVVEDQQDGPPGLLFPEATEAIVQRHPWLVPDWADAEGNIALRVQAFVVELGGRVVLVDPCVGNGKKRAFPFWNEPSWPFLERFAAAGFTPSGSSRRAHPPARRPRRLGHAARRRRLGSDLRRAPGICTRTRARVRARAHRCRETDVTTIRSARSSTPASPTWSRRTPTSATAFGSSRHPATRRATLALDRVAGRARADHRRLHASPAAVRRAAARREMGDADAEVARATRRPHALRDARATGALVLGTHFPNRPAGRITVTARRGGSSPSNYNIRCIRTTSSQRPNLRPTSRSQPTCSKSHLRCNAIDAS